MESAYSQGLLAGVSVASYAISLAMEKGMKLTIPTVKVLWLSFFYGSWLYFSLAYKFFSFFLINKLLIVLILDFLRDGNHAHSH